MQLHDMNINMKLRSRYKSPVFHFMKNISVMTWKLSFSKMKLGSASCVEMCNAQSEKLTNTYLGLQSMNSKAMNSLSWSLTIYENNF